MLSGSWHQLLWLLPVSALTAIVTWYASHMEGLITGYCLILVIIVHLTGLVLLLSGQTRIRNDGETHALKRDLAFGLFLYSIALNFILPALLLPITYGQVNRHYRGFIVLLLAPLAWVGVTAPARGEWARGIGAWLILFTHFFLVIYQFAHGESLYPGCVRYLE